ncbi:MAG: hypothetical protein NVSMB9_19720 [Isosphaeraceae bacterium]
MNRLLNAGILGLTLAGCAQDRSLLSQSRAPHSGVELTPPLPSIHEAINKENPRIDPSSLRAGHPVEYVERPRRARGSLASTIEPGNLAESGKSEGRPAPFADRNSAEPRPQANTSGTPPIHLEIQGEKGPQGEASAPDVAATEAAGPSSLPPLVEGRKKIEVPTEPAPGHSAPVLWNSRTPSPAESTARPETGQDNTRDPLHGGESTARPETRQENIRDPLLGADPDILPSTDLVPAGRKPKTPVTENSPQIPNALPSTRTEPASAMLPEPVAEPLPPPSQPDPQARTPSGEETSTAPADPAPSRRVVNDPLLGPNPDLMPVVKAPATSSPENGRKKGTAQASESAPRSRDLPAEGRPPLVVELPSNDQPGAAVEPAGAPPAVPVPPPASEVGIPLETPPGPVPSASSSHVPETQVAPVPPSSPPGIPNSFRPEIPMTFDTPVSQPESAAPFVQEVPNPRSSSEAKPDPKVIQLERPESSSLAPSVPRLAPDPAKPGEAPLPATREASSSANTSSQPPRGRDPLLGSDPDLVPSVERSPSPGKEGAPASHPTADPSEPIVLPSTTEAIQPGSSLPPVGTSSSSSPTTPAPSVASPSGPRSEAAAPRASKEKIPGRKPPAPRADASSGDLFGEPVTLPPLADPGASKPGEPGSASIEPAGRNTGFASVPVSASREPARDPSVRTTTAESPSTVRSEKLTRSVFEAGKPCARVGDDVITLRELKLAIAQRRKGIPTDRALSPDERYMLARSVLNDLVDRSVVLQEARREMKNPKQFKMLMEVADKIWTEEELPPLLRQNSVSNIHELRAKLSEKGESLDEVREQFRLEFLSRGYLEQKLGPKMKVELLDMRSYYLAHLKDFDLPAQVTWREVVVEVGSSGSRAEARKKADALLARLLHGEDFARLAKTESDGPNKSSGGLWRTAPDSYAVPAVNSALESLPIGQVSPVIEGPNSYHVVRVENRRRAGPATFAEVQDKIRRALRQEKVQRESTAYLDKLRKRTLIKTVFDAPEVTPTSGEQVITDRRP